MIRYWPILLWLLYFLFPYDIVPDFIPGFGRIDDILILLLLYWSYFRKGAKASSRPSDSSFETDGNAYEEAHEYNRHQESRHQHTQDPYIILGIRRSASLDDVKRAYRLKANQYHPDKVSHLGTEFQDLAKEKFQEIQWAYQQVMAERKGI